MGAELMTALGDADPARWRAVAGLDISGVSADSRRITPGMMFAALPGTVTDGRAHIADAVGRGAICVLAPRGTRAGVPVIEDDAPRRSLARIAAVLAGPQPGMVVAITGTNGKTSTAEFLRQIWTLDGTRAASLGTLGLTAPGFATGPGLTTPDPVTLAATLAALARAGVERAALEASSHGLDQHRLDGVRLAAAAFTNLTRDHLDYHGSMQAYADAKAMLFGWPGLRAAIVNLDDPWHAQMLAALAPGVMRIGYRIEPPTGGAAGDRSGVSEVVSEVVSGQVDRLLIARSIEPELAGMRIALDGHWGRGTIVTPLLGHFNVANLLAVMATWLALEVPFDAALAPLQALRPVPGRLQSVMAADGRQPLAVVDYAHTPDALSNALAALRPVAQRRGGLLWCVFGAGGDRDPGKRPLMAAAVEGLADRVVLTSDNPRSELPESILDAVQAGLTRAPALRESDRAAAIAKVIAQADAGDVVLIAGKGHESYQEIAGVRHPFDDVDHAARALARRSDIGGARGV